MIGSSGRPTAIVLVALFGLLASSQAACLFDTSVDSVTSTADGVVGEPDSDPRYGLDSGADLSMGADIDYRYGPDGTGPDSTGDEDTGPDDARPIDGVLADGDTGPLDAFTADDVGPDEEGLTTDSADPSDAVSTDDAAELDTTLVVDASHPPCEGPGFAPQPLVWSTPFGASTIDTLDSDSPLRLYALMDMNGDERPDLVVTYVYGETVGTDAWQVYLNEGKGFAATPLSWPTPFGASRTDTLDEVYPWHIYSLRDMNGDKRPDLVVAYRYGDDVGSDHWLVYLNDGSGFAKTPLVWPIPFSAYRPDTLEVEYPERVYTLVDMDGDERPDLVVTFVSGQTVGASDWLVYRNTGDGFAQTPLSWPLPFPANRPDTQHEPNAYRIYTLRDLDGDRRPDLVLTFTYGQPSAQKQWLVYHNGGDGFSATPLVWSVPFVANRPQTVDVEYPDRIYTLADMDGDDRPDLLITWVYDQSVGTHNWLVHRNTGSGFDTTPRCFPIPFRATRPDSRLDTSPLRLYALLDMDADKRPDLVLTFSFNEVLEPNAWWVYPNQL
ncbi:MAG: VCBS repeat-containing protein [Myxococcales bacterium]|nr:VCBS repeat-containing protein [Myxococcales bacterium]